MASTYDNWKLRAPEDEPGFVDPDEVQCSCCGALVDYHGVNEEGRCGKCESSVDAGGSPGCAAGTR